jgi:hypothetical protein
MIAVLEGRFRRWLTVNSVGEANKLPGDGSCGHGASGGNTTVIGRERGGDGSSISSRSYALSILHVSEQTRCRTRICQELRFSGLFDALNITIPYQYSTPEKQPDDEATTRN